MLEPPGGRERSSSHLWEQLEIPQQLLIQLILTQQLLVCTHTHTHTQKLNNVLYCSPDRLSSFCWILGSFQFSVMLWTALPVCQSVTTYSSRLIYLDVYWKNWNEILYRRLWSPQGEVRQLWWSPDFLSIFVVKTQTSQQQINGSQCCFEHMSSLT